MVETASGLAFSPFYPADYEEMRKAVVGQLWGQAAVGKATLRPPVPPLPEWQRSPNVKPRAVSRPGVVPQGYLSKPTAKAACEAAGKRLCRIEEWKTACRGEQNTRFPYGKKYEERVWEELATLDVGNFAGRLDRGRPHLVLHTLDNTEIRWGAELGKERSLIEAPQKVKARRIYQHKRLRGSLGAFEIIDPRPIRKDKADPLRGTG